MLMTWAWTNTCICDVLYGITIIPFGIFVLNSNFALHQPTTWWPKCSSLFLVNVFLWWSIYILLFIYTLITLQHIFSLPKIISLLIAYSIIITWNKFQTISNPQMYSHCVQCIKLNNLKYRANNNDYIK